MHKYHCVKRHRIPTGKDLESAYNLLNHNLNLYEEVDMNGPKTQDSSTNYVISSVNSSARAA